MKRGLQNYGSTINERNEGPSSSRSRPTHSSKFSEEYKVFGFTSKNPSHNVLI